MRGGRIGGILRPPRICRSRLVLLCIQLRAILGGKDVFAFQIFRGVNVLVFFLLVLLARAFLAIGFGNVLILSVTLRGANRVQRQSQNDRENAAKRDSKGAGVARMPGRSWCFEIQKCESNPTDKETAAADTIPRPRLFGY